MSHANEEYEIRQTLIIAEARSAGSVVHKMARKEIRFQWLMLLCMSIS